MRLAQGIITITITFFLGFTSMGSMIRNLLMQNSVSEHAANSGFSIAVILLVGAAFSFQVPIVAFISFLVSTVLSITVMIASPTNTIGYFVLFSFLFTLFSLATWLVDKGQKKRIETRSEIDTQI